jgi:hypothetical protein
VPLDVTSPKQAVCQLVAEAFVSKNVLTKYVKNTVPELVKFIDEHYYEAALSSKASALAYKHDKLVGAILNADKAYNVPFNMDEQPTSLQLLFEVIEYAEVDTLAKLSGSVLDSAASGTAIDLPLDESLFIMQEMEIYTMKRAKELGFSFIISLNTSPVTQVLNRCSETKHQRPRTVFGYLNCSVLLSLSYPFGINLSDHFPRILLDELICERIHQLSRTNFHFYDLLVRKRK